MNKALKHIVFAVTNDTLSDQRMDRICKSLISDGYKVTLVGRKFESSSLKVHKDLIHVVLLHVYFQKGPLFYFEYNLKLAFFLLFKSYDIGGAIDLDTIPGIRLATWLQRKKMTFDAHEFYTTTPELHNRNVKKAIWRILEKLFIRRIDLCYTVNKSLAQIFKDRYKMDFHIIRNVPLYDEKPITSPKSIQNVNPVILLYQGVINKGRGVEIYVEAIESLPTCHLWLAGDGDLFMEIQEIISGHPCKDRISLLGKVPPDELKILTLKSHIGLNILSEDSESYYFSLANKFFDYMHAGLPTINSRYPEYVKIIEKYNTGLLINHYTTKELVHAVQWLIDNPNEYSRLSKASLDARKYFSWQNEELKLKEIYYPLHK